MFALVNININIFLALFFISFQGPEIIFNSYTIIINALHIQWYKSSRRQSSQNYGQNDKKAESCTGKKYWRKNITR